MEPTNERRPNRTMLWVGGAAAAIGIAMGAAGIAAAATNDTSTSTTPAASSSGSTATATPNANAPAPPQDPATLPNGPGETLLTGDTAAKVTAAAKAAQPGATIIRVETDNEGAPYEAHVKKADGTVVTLKFDSNFNVTSTINGFGAGGPGGPGGHGPQGQAPSSSASSGSTTNG